MRFAEIAVDIPGDRVRTYTYSIPDGMAIKPGHAVRVPFGGRKCRGLVFEVSDTTVVQQIRDIEQFLDRTPFVNPSQLKVAFWIAKYYRVNLFQAVFLMFPPGFSETISAYLRATDEPRENLGVLDDRESRALALTKKSRCIRRDRLIRSLGRGGAGVIERLIRRGLLKTETIVERPRVTPSYRSVVSSSVLPGNAHIIADNQRSLKRAALIRLLANSSRGLPRPELVKQFGRSAVSGVIQAGFAVVKKKRVNRDPLEGRIFTKTVKLNPTADQANAIEHINFELNADRNVSVKFLVNGVTGSGKTEVYLQSIEACIASGRQAIILVPEIALTPQAIERYAGRFPGKIAVLHSGLTLGERFDQWWAVRRGDYNIVLGSRSAIFAPLQDVGLVVVDEEHEWTYKQHDKSPRYHARAVAEKLCEITGGVLIAGSATPDVETFRRVEQGEYVELRMPTRAGTARGRLANRTAAGQANVHVVNMKNELRAGHSELFSRQLKDAIDEALNFGGRVILYMNRRGAGSFAQCGMCGYVSRCRRCDTTLVYHLSQNKNNAPRLTCHYCNYSILYSRICRSCDANAFSPLGFGTQRVAEEATRLYPGAGILRWDRDTAKTARSHSALLQKFSSGNHRILVGTQMVAKGIDIPEVTLVGVVSADTGLSIPDFRAGERSFQLLTQVAGRVGRGPMGGKAIIQTFQPDHYAISMAAAQDFQSFYAAESELRRRYNYPPFSKLIRLNYGDLDADRARGKARDFADRLRRKRSLIGENSTEVLGPSPSYPSRVRGFTRWHILLKGPTPHRLLDNLTTPRGWTIDVDPATVS